MIGRIIEIASEGCYLSVFRGFLQVNQKSNLVGQVPLDDISAVIANAHGLSYSNNVLTELCERGIPLVICGSNHMPIAIVWPIENHHRQAARIDAQLAAKLPHKKRLWQHVVRAKISMQACSLDFYNIPSNALLRMIDKVKTGDSSNTEGQAARLYWTSLMGKNFRRDRNATGANALLNYGYTILRATVARYLIAAGLHPGIPIFHKNEGNAMRLVDDVMEPFRPIVDLFVKRMVDNCDLEITPQTKRLLATIPSRSLRTNIGISPITLVIQRTCVSLAQAFETPCRTLDFPKSSALLFSSLFDEPSESKADASAA